MSLVIHHGHLFNAQRERVRTTLIRERERSHPEPSVTDQTGRITYFSPGLIKISPLTLSGGKMQG